MKEKKNSEKVLLHACCGICSGQPIMHLRELGYEPIVYFYNPNVTPELEYQKRLNAQQKLCKELHCELVIAEYNKTLYDEVMTGYEKYSEGSLRCKRCFELRLLKTIQYAKESNIKYYTTSLAISPHKNFGLIKEIGNFFASYYGIKFLDIDFRKKDGALKTNQIAKSLNLYRQSYCGCQNSIQTKPMEKAEIA